MKNDIEKIIDELKNDNDSLKKYIECFIEIEKVKEENSKEYQELKEMIEFDEVPEDLLLLFREIPLRTVMVCVFQGWSYG